MNRHRHRHRLARTRAAGLTLMEMLVTLVILAMVAGILGQALGQLSRIERLLEAGQLRSAVVSLRAEWVRDALAALIPGTREADRLRGSARELRGWSSDPPQLPAPGLGRLTLRVLTDERALESRLELLSDPGQDAAPVVLLRWPGREGRFVYRDAQGHWGEQWPPMKDGAPAPGLPRALALDTGAEGPGFILAVPLASPDPQPGRAALEAM